MGLAWPVPNFKWPLGMCVARPTESLRSKEEESNGGAVTSSNFPPNPDQMSERPQKSKILKWQSVSESVTKGRLGIR